jgi:hypothetical protein
MQNVMDWLFGIDGFVAWTWEHSPGSVVLILFCFLAWALFWYHLTTLACVTLLRRRIEALEREKGGGR